MPSDSDSYTWYTADGGRCFVGKGYSEEYCSQDFDTAEEARQHGIEFHAVPERMTVTRHTTATVKF